MNKYLKIFISIILVSIIIASLSYIYIVFIKEDKVAILTYHNVVDTIEDDPNTTVSITTEKFEKQIKWLKKHNYKSITMDEFYNWKINNKKIPRKSILITFDDGWKSYYTKAIPILEKYDMKSSVFVVFSYVKKTSETNGDTYINYEDIKDIINNHPNSEILSHSYNLHEKERADSNDYELYNNDIKEVEKEGYNIKYYAYPYGHRNDNYIKALKDNNYRLAFTFGPYDFATKENNNYEIPRLGVFESTKDWKLKIKLFLEE